MTFRIRRPNQPSFRVGNVYDRIWHTARSQSEYIVRVDAAMRQGHDGICSFHQLKYQAPVIMRPTFGELQQELGINEIQKRHLNELILWHFTIRPSRYWQAGDGPRDHDGESIRKRLDRLSLPYGLSFFVANDQRWRPCHVFLDRPFGTKEWLLFYEGCRQQPGAPPDLLMELESLT